MESISLDKQSEHVGSFEKVWCEGWDSPCVDTANEDFEIQSQASIIPGSTEREELSLMSRASSICSLKIQHQLTILQMYFGKRNEIHG